MYLFGKPVKPKKPPKERTVTTQEDMVGACTASGVNVVSFMPFFTLVLRSQTSGQPPLSVLGDVLKNSNGSIRTASATLYKGVGSALFTVGTSRVSTYGIMGAFKSQLPEDWAPYKKDFASGLVASVLKVVLTQPSDRMKVLNQNGFHLSFSGYVKFTMSTQGITGFWSGGTISAVKSMGGTPLWITAKNHCNRLFERHLGPVTTPQDQHARAFTSGFLASLFTLPITYPLDTSKSMVMAMRPAGDSLRPISLGEVAKEFKALGLRRVYRGSMLQFVLYMGGGSLFNVVQEGTAQWLASRRQG